MIQKIPTLYSSYQELILDLDIYGKIVSTPQQSIEEMTSTLFEEFQRRKPFPTLEEKRYELSRLVSQDYKIVYNRELEMQDNENLIDLNSNSSESNDISFDNLSPLVPKVMEIFSYENQVTDDIRESIIAKYSLETGEEFKPGILQTTKIVNSVEEDESLVLSDEEVEMLGVEPKIEADEIELDYISEPSIDLTTSEPEEVDVSLEDGLIEDDYEGAEEDLEDDYSEYEDDSSEESEDTFNEEDDDEEYEDDYYDYEDDSNDEELEDDYSEYEDETDESEDDYSEYDNEEDDYSEYDNETDDSEDDYSEYEDETDDSEDDYSEYEDDSNEEYGDFSEYAEELTEGTSDSNSSVDNDQSSYSVFDDLIASQENGSGFIDSVIEEDDGVEFIDSSNLVKKVETPITPPQIHNDVKKSVEVDRTSEPTDLREFLRKHPRCEYNFALQYFTKKQISDAIKIGKITKKGNTLRLI